MTGDLDWERHRMGFQAVGRHCGRETGVGEMLVAPGLRVGMSDRRVGNPTIVPT
jgi:hypothetical protein